MRLRAVGQQAVLRQIALVRRFRDPLPPELVRTPPTLYEWAGGIEALERLTARFYDEILTEPDPVLEHARGRGGYEHMVAEHRGLGLTETQRRRWVARMIVTADEVGLPEDPDLRSTLMAYLEWGTRIAVINSRRAGCPGQGSACGTAAAGSSCAPVVGSPALARQSRPISRISGG